MNEKIPVDLIITLYETQINKLIMSDEVVTRRVNFYMTIVSAILAIVLFIAQFVGFLNSAVNIAMILVLTVVLMIGLMIYAEVTQWVIVTVQVQSEQLRLMKYLIQRYPDLSSLVLTIPPKRTELVVVRRRKLVELLDIDIGQKQIVTILNNTLASAISVIVALTIFSVTNWIVVLLTLVFILFWILQIAYSRMRYRFANRSENIEKFIVIKAEDNDTEIQHKENVEEMDVD